MHGGVQLFSHRGGEGCRALYTRDVPLLIPLAPIAGYYMQCIVMMNEILMIILCDEVCHGKGLVSSLLLEELQLPVLKLLHPKVVIATKKIRPD